MTLLHRIKQAFNVLFRKEITFDNFPQGVPLGNSGLSGSDNFVNFANEGFIQNPSVYACIEYVERATKAITFQLQKNGEDVDEDDPSAAVILRTLERPNKFQSMSEFISNWSINMQIGGIAYMHMTGIGSESLGDIDRIKTEGELHLLRPDRVKIVHDGRDIQAFEYRPEGAGTVITLAPEEVFYTRYPHPLDMFKGMSPMQAGARIIDAHNRSLSWWDSLIANNGKLSGVLGLKGMANATPNELDRLQKSWQEKYSGPQNAGKTAILPGEGFDYTSLGSTPAELDWLGSEAILTRRICTVFGVPSQLLGDPDTSKYSNYKEARRAFFTEKVLPDEGLFIGESNAWWLSKYGPEWSIRADVSKVDALQDDENDTVDRLLKRSWWTVNMKLEAEGKEPVDGGDVLYQAFNLVPLGSENDTDTEASRSTRTDDMDALPHVHPRSRYPSELDRRVAFEKLDKKKIKWEKDYRRELNEFWDSQQKTINAAVSSTGVNLISLFASSGQDALLTEAVSEVNIGLILDFGQEALDDLIAKGILFDVERPAIAQFIAKDLPRRSRLINETTATRLQNIINEGVAKNEGVLKIKQRILDKFTEMSTGRARTIAQTEVGRAAGKATLEGMKQFEEDTDTKLDKEWITSRDGDVRDDHVFMDGQVVDIDEDFEGPGGQSSSQVPPDSGDPGFDINCRCVMAALKPGDKKV